MRRASRWGRRGIVAMACATALAGAPAEAATRPQPPSAAAFERVTDSLLDRPVFGRAATADVPRAPATTAPLFPDDLYVTLYGAPQLTSTELGVRSPRSAAREARRLAGSYERASGSDAVPGFDLVAVVANSTPGPDRKYRTRQPDEIVSAYLRAARRAEGRLMLDIQPGRSTAVGEIRALERWFSQPDVDAAIDPEWNVGRKGVPGRTTGVIDAAEINAASRLLQRIVEREDLPPKVLVIHQFTEEMIRGRRAIRQRDDVQVVLNFDGIGSPAAKEAGYEALAMRRLFNGFSLFVRLDTRLMKPRSVLRLSPAVSFLLYQ